MTMLALEVAGIATRPLTASALLLAEVRDYLIGGGICLLGLAPILIAFRAAYRQPVDQPSLTTRLLSRIDRYSQVGGGAAVGYMIGWLVSAALPTAYPGHSTMILTLSLAGFVVCLYCAGWFVAARIYVERRRSTEDHGPSEKIGPIKGGRNH